MSGWGDLIMGRIQDYLASRTGASLIELCQGIGQLHLELRQSLGRWKPYSLKPMKCRLLGGYYSNSKLFDSNELPEIEFRQIAFPKVTQSSERASKLEFEICAEGDVATSGSFMIKAGVVVNKDANPDFIFVPPLLCDMNGNFMERDRNYYHELMLESRQKSARAIFCGVIHSELLVSKFPATLINAANPQLDYVVTEKEIVDISRG